MYFDYLFKRTKTYLESAEKKIDADDYDAALAFLSKSYGYVRELMESTWRRKREASIRKNPPGENTL